MKMQRRLAQWVHAINWRIASNGSIEMLVSMSRLLTAALSMELMAKMTMSQLVRHLAPGSQSDGKPHGFNMQQDKHNVSADHDLNM
jgi:hypothetical protein